MKELFGKIASAYGSFAGEKYMRVARDYRDRKVSVFVQVPKVTNARVLAAEAKNRQVITTFE